MLSFKNLLFQAYHDISYNFTFYMITFDKMLLEFIIFLFIAIAIVVKTMY